jgi:hypothetical protein
MLLVTWEPIILGLLLAEERLVMNADQLRTQIWYSLQPFEIPLKLPRPFAIKKYKRSFSEFVVYFMKT